MAVDYEIDLDALLITHHGDPVGRIPIIGYIRVSTAREDMISPEMQADAVNAWAASTGRRIVLWVADLDLSGRTLAKRQISGIIDSIATRSAVDGARQVGVRTFDRFGRNRADNAMNLSRLERAGGQLLSATEQVDAATAIGRFARGMLFEVAALKSDLIGEGWREVHAYRLARGLPHTGAAKFGYDRLGRIKFGDKYVVDPDDPEERYALGDLSPQLGRMFMESAEGAPTMHLVKWLLEGRIPSVLGNVDNWSNNAVLSILDSGFGCGYIIAHNPKCESHEPDGAGNCKNRVELPGAQPHVFADDNERDDVWDAYKNRRQQGKKLGPRAKEAKYEATGLMRCRWCHRSMSAIPSLGHDHPPNWRCLASLNGACPGRQVHDSPVQVSGRQVLYALWSLITSERDRLAEIAEATEAHNPTSAPATDAAADVQKIQADILDTRRRLDALTEAYAEGDIPADSYRRTRDKHQAREAELAAQLAEAKQARTRGPEDHVAIMGTLIEEWPTLAAWTRNAILRDLVAQAEVWRVSSDEAWIRVTTAWGTAHLYPAAGRLTSDQVRVLRDARVLA
ncbi:recombinase family protein [Nocardiopsis sp. CT-R113]|uniref:Recombinase family protein n=1 Tax=Nocardiopsis codii TaxID=3065942 RepID=A0ABU7KGB1_9ACTN|nr:recombinase family protein [Nocardiopsis sp. CT-R113]MEE2041248.1 recombinase family protein [Nocardiopsis sp. CT-R113]